MSGNPQTAPSPSPVGDGVTEPAAVNKAPAAGSGPRTPGYVIQKRHRLRKLRGETAYIDAAPARGHLATLLCAGWSVRSIAGESGVPATTVSRLNTGKQLTARPATIEALLAVRAEHLAEGTNNPDAEPFVSRVGTVRRIQALLYMGWGHKQMRAHSGLQTSSLNSQQGRWVRRSTHDRVAEMYRELSTRRGPSTRAAHYAQLLGYAGPLDWDDIDHDLAPAVAPVPEPPGDFLDEAAIERRIAGDRAVPLTKVEAAELVRRWQASGRPLAECDRLTGINSHRFLRHEEQAS